MQKQSLFEKLAEYNSSDIYPFCMPGHKQRMKVDGLSNPYEADITEMIDFDDLHDPHGIIKDIMDEAAAVYGCPNTFISVNGSTACNLAAMSVIPEGGPVLVAANCHRSVINGAKINRRQLIRLAPEWIGSAGIYGGISPEALENAFKGYPDIKAFVLTSPTYEGFISDIPKIAEIVHSHGAILIVDEAHGSHLPYSSRFPMSALECGKTGDKFTEKSPDIVIQSLHKAVGSMNQTAWLFVPNDELAQQANEKLLMYVTTSPSYLLMASMQQAVRRASSPEGQKMVDHYIDNLLSITENLKDLQKIELINDSYIGGHAITDRDFTKLVLVSRELGGKELFRIMYDDYRIQLEKYGDYYAVAMSALYDTDEGFDRLEKAVKDLDRRLISGEFSGEEAEDHRHSKTIWQ